MSTSDEDFNEDDLNEDYIIPSVFNRDVAPAVAEAVVQELTGGVAFEFVGREDAVEQP